MGSHGECPATDEPLGRLLTVARRHVGDVRLDAPASSHTSGKP
ncbi:hypothetical protein ACH4PU_25405 [Streptomyces sp. NPDC021100]